MSVVQATTQLIIFMAVAAEVLIHIYTGVGLNAEISAQASHPWQMAGSAAQLVLLVRIAANASACTVEVLEISYRADKIAPLRPQNAAGDDQRIATTGVSSPMRGKKVVRHNNVAINKNKQFTLCRSDSIISRSRQPPSSIRLPYIPNVES